MRSKFGFLVILLASCTFAQVISAPISSNQNGVPASAKVTLCSTNPGSGACASPVTTYTSIALSTACSGTATALNNENNASDGSGCSNPGYSDSNGNVVIFANPGSYWCQFSGITTSPYSRPCPSAGTGKVGVVTFGPVIPNMTYARIHVETAGTGDIDLYTVPANSRAIANYYFSNLTAGSIAAYPEIKTGGVYYEVGASFTYTTHVAGPTNYTGIILEAGETFAVHTGASGANIFGTAWVFPNTVPIQTVKVTSLASGDNTVFTCPLSVNSCTPLLGASQITGSSNGALAPVVFNASGGALSYYFNLVKSGDSVSSANQVTFATSTANGAAQAFNTGGNWTMGPGDFLSINASGTSAGLAWVSIFEQ